MNARIFFQQCSFWQQFLNVDFTGGAMEAIEMELRSSEPTSPAQNEISDDLCYKPVSH